MNAERWKKIKQIFSETLERVEGERESYMQGTCGDDEELLAEVRSLIQAYTTRAQWVGRWKN